MTIFAMIVTFIAMSEGYYILQGKIKEQAWKSTIDPTKKEIMDEHWLEFIDWIQDARTIRNLAPPYNVYTDTRDVTPRNVALVTENNFWLWFCEYKWDKKEALERNKNRKESKTIK